MILLTRAAYEKLVRDGERAKQLEDQVVELRALAAYERERGARAVDELLVKLGAAPVTPPPADPDLGQLVSMFEEEDQDMVEIVRKRMEREGAAQVLLESKDDGF